MGCWNRIHISRCYPVLWSSWGMWPYYQNPGSGKSLNWLNRYILRNFITQQYRKDESPYGGSSYFRFKKPLRVQKCHAGWRDDNRTQARVDSLGKGENKTSCAEEGRWGSVARFWPPTKEGNCHRTGSTSQRLNSGEVRLDLFLTTVWSPGVEKSLAVISDGWQHVEGETKQNKEKVKFGGTLQK